MKHQMAIQIWCQACQQYLGDDSTTNSTFLGGVAMGLGLETSAFLLKGKEKKDIAFFLREWADAIELN